MSLNYNLTETVEFFISKLYKKSYYKEIKLKINFLSPFFSLKNFIIHNHELDLYQNFYIHFYHILVRRFGV